MACSLNIPAIGAAIRSTKTAITLQNCMLARIRVYALPAKALDLVSCESSMTAVNG